MFLIFLIIIVSLILQLFLPWWIIALIAFPLAFWKARSAGHAFGSGFIAIFLLWVVMGLFKSFPNEHLLANRVGEMFMLPPGSSNWIFMLLATGIVGGLVGGISALAGFMAGNAFKSRQGLKGA
ncbi:hypothetical protein GZH53_09810 [Flavihumibacter sp. R14]|nr:hypothetical protein [Flavihumibacter soli]